MTLSSSQLMNEFRALRRGRGLHTPGLDRLVGPALRELCGIGEDDGAEVARERIRNWVLGEIENFPEDLRTATATALGLNLEAQQPFLGERVRWLARGASRDARTIRRRMEAGLTRLVEAADRRPARDGAGKQGDAWHVRRFSAVLRMDGPTPVCTERREIVAARDGIEWIPWSISLPRGTEGMPADLDVRVAHGAVLSSTERPSARRFLMGLQLPERLDAGQTHTFSLEVRIPQGQVMRPTYVFWPERRCERFDLVIRFGLRQPPETVWRLSDVFHRDADDCEPGSDLLTVNGVGEVAASFTEPRPGRGYGIQWRP
ncbi:hypothetical protein [Amycolatopsis cihanbeyliensis]|uniref:Uncharacterized protein n=1 Tax=Amycolatopsis cihanbeyliensis TaxID=1128664 RepID=A0A542DI64_AMYCI|nr:hypothetical protein [Amycolatopsis cihanbeyliensis]TQJ02788.1 hypothetical protein FB471_2533 [Amycolatopsis cihanbeyliensis]